MPRPSEDPRNLRGGSRVWIDNPIAEVSMPFFRRCPGRPRCSSGATGRLLVCVFGLSALVLGAWVSPQVARAADPLPAPEAEPDAALEPVPGDSGIEVGEESVEIPDEIDAPLPPEEAEAPGVPGEPTRIQVRKGRSDRKGGDERARVADQSITFGRDVHVEAGDTVEGDLVVIRGDATIDGRVSGDVLAVGGDIYASGEVRGGVVSIGGSVELKPTTVCGGDVVAVGGSIEANGAEIDGESVELSFFSGDALPGARVAALLAPLLGLACFVLVLLALSVAFAPSFEAMTAALEARPWRCLGVGALAGITTGFGILLLAITVVGLPIVLLIGIGVAVFSQIARVLVAARLGRWIVPHARSGWVRSLAGGVLLHGLWFAGALLAVEPGATRALGLALLLFLVLVDLACVLAGTGAALSTRLGRRSRSWAEHASAAPVSTAPTSP